MIYKIINGILFRIIHIYKSSKVSFKPTLKLYPSRKTKNIHAISSLIDIMRLNVIYYDVS